MLSCIFWSQVDFLLKAQPRGVVVGGWVDLGALKGKWIAEKVDLQSNIYRFVKHNSSQEGGEQGTGIMGDYLEQCHSIFPEAKCQRTQMYSSEEIFNIIPSAYSSPMQIHSRTQLYVEHEEPRGFLNTYVWMESSTYRDINIDKLQPEILLF